MEKLKVILDWFPQHQSHRLPAGGQSGAGLPRPAWRWKSAAKCTEPCTSTGRTLSAARRSPCWTAWSRGGDDLCGRHDPEM